MTAPEAGNTRLRSARQALGLRSQQQLAEAVTRAGSQIGVRISITERTARRWESDNPPWPQPEHQAALEQLFGRPVTELGFTPPWAGDVPKVRPPEQTGASPAVTASVAAGARSVPQARARRPASRFHRRRLPECHVRLPAHVLVRAACPVA